MIPLSLTVQNFLSYGATPQTISFHNHQLICFSGKNGHGKSALLDAMTWAVWGAARKIGGTSKPDDGLLRLGSRQMMVLFTFTVNGKTYQVRREYSRTNGKPHATLDFSLQDQTTGRYISLTDKTIRKTQEKIITTIGIDYDTYTNSVFLRQGNANEFSKKSPKERKQIVTTILGLDRYDTLAKKAQEKSRGLTQELHTVTSFLAQDEQFFEEHKDTDTSYQATEKELVNVSLKKETLTESYNTFMAGYNRVQEEKKRYQELRREYAALDQEIVAKRLQWGNQAAVWRRKNSALLALPHHEQVKEKKELLEQQLTTMRVAQSTLAQVHTEKARCQQKYHEYVVRQEAQHAQAEQELLQEITRVKEQVSHADAHSKKIEEHVQELEARGKKLRETQTALARKQEEAQKKITFLLQQREQFEKRRSRYQLYDQRRETIARQLEQQKLDYAALNDDNNPACPLCEQRVSAGRRKLLREGVNRRIARLSWRHARLHKILIQLTALLTEQKKQLQAYQEQEAQYAQLVSEQAVVRSHIASLKQEYLAQKSQMLRTQEQYKNSQEKLATLLATYKKNREQWELQKEQDSTRKACQKELAAYDEQQKKLEKQLVGLTDLEREYATIEKRYAQVQEGRQEQLAQVERRNSLSLLREAITAGEKKKRAYEHTLARVPEHTDAYTRYEQEKQALDTQLEQVRVAQERLLIEKGRLAQIQAEVSRRKERYAERVKKRSIIAGQIDNYQVLAQAWGKNGVQALLIEQALPEIEQEANELLGRLTNNQAQIFIESLRDLKKGGVRETLDIKISDAAGVRPYELFSGGEAFRIDFSLRIALSKLLARRAGTSLQVLIIDEGFGSQDEEGLAHLMSALYAIQDEFERIIIVSHLDALKENFPVHYIITKQPTGSVVSIEERG